MKLFSPQLLKPRSTIRWVERDKMEGFRFLGNNLAIEKKFLGRNHILSRFASVSSITPADAGKKAYEIRKQKGDQKSNESVKSRKRSCMQTVLSHAGLPISDNDSSHNEPLAPPLHLESTYTRPPSGDYFNKEDGGNGLVYSRMGNPTRNLLEDTLKELELSHSSQTQNCSSEAITCAFSSGMAAVSAVVLALPQPLHIILPDDIYHGVPTQLKALFLQRGVTFASTDMTNMSSIEDEILSAETDDILVWMESPSNPGCKVTDIEAVCKLVSQYKNGLNVTTVVDSTWAPPTLTQPLLLGADTVLHSGTKYLGGHSDVLLGVVTTSPYTSRGKELGQLIRSVQTSVGSTASPMDCWLTLRGLRTLHLRVERQCQTAMELAKFLQNHDFVERVHYPGLPSHPQHETAIRQMNGGFGGMLSFEMKDEATAMAVAGACSVIKRATSLGGTETLIEHRASIEPEDGRVSPDGLLRVSIGLESAVDLKDDLNVALQVAQEVVG